MKYYFNYWLFNNK